MRVRLALTFVLSVLLLTLIVAPGSARNMQPPAGPAPAGVDASPGAIAPWLVESVDGGQSVGTHVSVAIDAEGTPYISYYDDANKDLKMAKHVGEGGNRGGPEFHWECQTVDKTVPGVGKYSSIAIDPTTNLPVIAYWKESPLELRVATLTTYGWAFATVKQAVGRYASLKNRRHGSCPHRLSPLWCAREPRVCEIRRRWSGQLWRRRLPV
jgi:hypothetical protein